MTIKNRGLGRGLEALLVNVGNLKEAQEQTHLNSNAAECTAIEKEFRPLGAHNISKNPSNTLAYEQTDKVSNVLHLLNEAESLRALLIEFEEILIHR